MKRKLVAGVALAAIVVGCASTPVPNATLDSARTLVQSAEADPNVSKYAAIDLDTAKKQLAVAEAAVLRHDDANVTQPAYLAGQTARLAQYRAAAGADDARVAAGKTERDQIQLAARDRDAAAASSANAAAAAKAAALKAELDALKAKQTN